MGDHQVAGGRALQELAFGIYQRRFDPEERARGRAGLELGDTSTLADPGVVDDLVENRQNRAA